MYRKSVLFSCKLMALSAFCAVVVGAGAANATVSPSALSAPASSQTDPGVNQPVQIEDDDVGVFVDLEWRVLNLAEHLSHGPGFAAGVTLWGGYLRLGLAGITRPGPWNPATFDVQLPRGSTYHGQRELALRSDGAMAGAHLALALPMPSVRWLSITLPLTLGYGGFGFYLHGEDRVTPDGRRVSEWEDELFGGNDSHLGLVVDGGLRVNILLPQQPRFRPYAALYYTTVPGFSTLLRDDYSGFSAAVGIEVGYGL